MLAVVSTHKSSWSSKQALAIFSHIRIYFMRMLPVMIEEHSGCRATARLSDCFSCRVFATIDVEFIDSRIPAFRIMASSAVTDDIAEINSYPPASSATS